MQLPSFGCGKDFKREKKRKSFKKWMKRCELIALATGHIAYCVYMFEFEEWLENQFVCQLPANLKFLLNQVTWDSCSGRRIYDFTRCKNVNVSKALGFFFYGAWVFIIKKKRKILIWKVKMTVKHIQKEVLLSNTHFNDIGVIESRWRARMNFSRISYLMQIQSNQIAWSITGILILISTLF